MLGWHISIYRQTEGQRLEAASFDSESGDRLAVWQADLNGLDWLDELVGQGEALRLGGNGYPSRWTGKAAPVLRRIGTAPPGARRSWASDPGDILTDAWLGKTTFFDEAIAACADDEWLLVEVWDES